MSPVWLAWILAMQASAPPAQAATPPPASARPIQAHGRIEAVADAVPKQDATELRSRAILEIDGQLPKRLRLRFDGAVAALTADRGGADNAAIVDVRDAWIEYAAPRVEVRAGFGRLSWGRLDEIQPTDVINPLDTARFLMEGRAEARRAIAFVRGRVFAGEKVTIESILAPMFRRGTFDALDEPRSPFNLVNDAVLPAGVAIVSPDIERREPAVISGNVSGGARVQATAGRVDVSAMVYRGFDGIGPVTFEPLGVAPVAGAVMPTVVGRLIQDYPRFTMIGADMEAIAGEFAIRGETAWFTERHVAGVTQAGLVNAASLDAGVGVDRRAGDYHVFSSLLVHRQWSDVDPAVARTDVSIVGSVDRSLARERVLARLFAVVNPGDATAFVRGLVTWTVRDNVGVDVSAAGFYGAGDDTLARFHGRDFVFGRVRYHF